MSQRSLKSAFDSSQPRMQAGVLFKPPRASQILDFDEFELASAVTRSAWRCPVDENIREQATDFLVALKMTGQALSKYNLKYLSITPGYDPTIITQLFDFQSAPPELPPDPPFTRGRVTTKRQGSIRGPASYSGGMEEFFDGFDWDWDTSSEKSESTETPRQESQDKAVPLNSSDTPLGEPLGSKNDVAKTSACTSMESLPPASGSVGPLQQRTGPAIGLRNAARRDILLPPFLSLVAPITKRLVDTPQPLDSSQELPSEDSEDKISLFAGYSESPGKLFTTTMRPLTELCAEAKVIFFGMSCFGPSSKFITGTSEAPRDSMPRGPALGCHPTTGIGEKVNPTNVNSITQRRTSLLATTTSDHDLLQKDTTIATNFDRPKHDHVSEEDQMSEVRAGGLEDRKTSSAEEAQYSSISGNAINCRFSFCRVEELLPNLRSMFPGHLPHYGPMIVVESPRDFNRPDADLKFPAPCLHHCL